MINETIKPKPTAEVAGQNEPIVMCACIVHGCSNFKHQGRFEGNICAPCYAHITTGLVGSTTSFIGDLAMQNQSLKEWQEKVFSVYPNIDVDIECID